jgi:hypothetical protein
MLRDERRAGKRKRKRKRKRKLHCSVITPLQRQVWAGSGYRVTNGRLDHHPPFLYVLAWSRSLTPTPVTGLDAARGNCVSAGPICSQFSLKNIKDYVVPHMPPHTYSHNHTSHLSTSLTYRTARPPLPYAHQHQGQAHQRIKASTSAHQRIRPLHQHIRVNAPVMSWILRTQQEHSAILDMRPVQAR